MKSTVVPLSKDQEKLNTVLWRRAGLEQTATNELQHLIDQGADVNAVTNNSTPLHRPNSTPLHRAVIADNAKVVAFLIDQGAEVNAQNGEGFTRLHWIITRGNTVLGCPVWCDRNEMCELLIKKGAEVSPDLLFMTLNSPIPTYSTDELQNVMRNNHSILCSLLIDAAPHLINAQFNWGETPLQVAASRGHTEICDKLISMGALANAIVPRGDYKDYTALHFAAEKGNYTTAEKLIERDAKLDVESYWTSETPLSLAADNAHTEVCRLLLDKGARPFRNLQDRIIHYYWMDMRDTFGEWFEGPGANVAICKLFLQRTLFFPNEIDVKECRARIKTALLCFCRYAPRMPKDIKKLLLTHDPQIRKEVATIMSSLVQNGEGIPQQYLTCTVDELTKLALSIIKSELLYTQSRAKDNSIKKLLAPEKAEEIIHSNIGYRIKNPRKCFPWQILPNNYVESKRSLENKQWYKRLALYAIGTVTIFWLAKKLIFDSLKSDAKANNTNKKEDLNITESLT